jgi:Zn ribbon nucleic-acid-binding protein
MNGNADRVCWECVTDGVLRQWLRKNGRVGTCSFCGKRRVACPLPTLAKTIDEKLREFYRPTEQTAHIVRDSDNIQYWADGEVAAVARL